MSDKVRHRGTPAEPWAKPGEHGTITRTATDGLRITPAGNGAPAMAHVAWNGEHDFCTWERLCDLTRLSEGKRR